MSKEVPVIECGRDTTNPRFESGGLLENAMLRASVLSLAGMHQFYEYPLRED